MRLKYLRCNDSRHFGQSFVVIHYSFVVIHLFTIFHFHSLLIRRHSFIHHLSFSFIIHSSSFIYSPSSIFVHYSFVVIHLFTIFHFHSLFIRLHSFIHHLSFSFIIHSSSFIYSPSFIFIHCHLEQTNIQLFQWRIFNLGGLDLSRSCLDWDSRSRHKKTVSLDGRENLDRLKKLVSTIEISQSRLRNIDFVSTSPSRYKYLDQDWDLSRLIEIYPKSR